MVDKGYVKSWLADPAPERGGKAKRYYQLQADGQRAFVDSAQTGNRIYQILGKAFGFGKLK